MSDQIRRNAPSVLVDRWKPIEKCLSDVAPILGAKLATTDCQYPAKNSYHQCLVPERLRRRSDSNRIRLKEPNFTEEHAARWDRCVGMSSQLGPTVRL